MIAALAKWRGISFYSWKLSSYSRFTQVLPFVRPPVAKELHRVLCLILGVDRFQRKCFCIFSISSIMCFGTTHVRHKWIISDKTNVLKTIILPSEVKFLMRHILRTVWIFDIAVKTFFFHAKLIIVWKMNSESLDGIYF